MHARISQHPHLQDHRFSLLDDSTWRAQAQGTLLLVASSFWPHEGSPGRCASILLFLVAFLLLVATPFAPSSVLCSYPPKTHSQGGCERCLLLTLRDLKPFKAHIWLSLAEAEAVAAWCPDHSPSRSRASLHQPRPAMAHRGPRLRRSERSTQLFQKGNANALKTQESEASNSEGSYLFCPL